MALVSRAWVESFYFRFQYSSVVTLSCFVLTITFLRPIFFRDLFLNHKSSDVGKGSLRVCRLVVLFSTGTFMDLIGSSEGCGAC